MRPHPRRAGRLAFPGRAAILGADPQPPDNSNARLPLTLRSLAHRTLLLGLVLAALPLLALAQGAQDDSIFQRFAGRQEQRVTRMAMLEVPVALRPQTFPDAEIEENLGLGYTLSFQPENRVFTSLGIHLARMEWRPRDPNIDFIDVKQLDVTQSLNFWVERAFTISIGLGIGILDGLAVFADGRFDHEVVPYIPVRIGVAVPLSRRLYAGLRLAVTPFFADAPVRGSTRLLFGLGLAY